MSDIEYTFERPPDNLVPFVRRIMWMHRRNDARALQSKPLPSGHSYLGWIPYGSAHAYLDGREVFSTDDYRIHASGQIYRGDVDFRMDGAAYHVVAELKAAGAYQLIGIPGSAYTDLCIDPSHQNPNLAQHLVGLKEFRESGPLHEYQERFLAALTSLSKVPHSVPQYLITGIAYIEKADGVFNLSKLCEELQVSVRQFTRVFHNIVGIPPKFFGKTIQISRAISLMLSGSSQLSQVAHDAGFTDQAHFNNAFRSMILSSPKEFLHSADLTIASVMKSARL